MSETMIFIFHDSDPSYIAHVKAAFPQEWQTWGDLTAHHCWAFDLPKGQRPESIWERLGRDDFWMIQITAQQFQFKPNYENKEKKNMTANFVDADGGNPMAPGDGKWVPKAEAGPSNRAGTKALQAGGGAVAVKRHDKREKRARKMTVTGGGGAGIVANGSDALLAAATPPPDLTARTGIPPPGARPGKNGHNAPKNARRRGTQG